MTDRATVAAHTTLLVTAPPARLPERRYILDVVLRGWLGFDYRLEPANGRVITIRPIDAPATPVLTLPDALFRTADADWLTERSMPATPLAALSAEPGAPDAAPFPVLFGDPGPGGQAWRASPDGIALRVDVFGTAFFLLTRYEEVVRPNRDAHGRFPVSSSLAARFGFLDRALVDEQVDLLWRALQRLWPGLERLSSEFRLRLTHDVDLPWASLARRALVGDLVRRRDPALAARRVRSFLDAARGRYARDPFNTFGFLMDTSERHGLRSTFYFRAGGPRADRAARYRLSDPPVQDALRRIHARGHEVGLHAGYEGYRSPEAMQAERDVLVDACHAAGFDQAEWGVRQHFLRFDNPLTWRSHASAGLTHDSSLAFAERVGFRAGTCREYPVFDLLERRVLPVRERPLVVMDATLLGYLGLSLDEAAAAARDAVAVCRRHRGDAVLLYHNDSLWGPRQQTHYRELVADIAGG